MDETPAQQPLKQSAPSGKEIPDPNTDFGDEAFDSSAMPQSRISPGGLNEWIFGLMRPKSKVPTRTQRIARFSGPSQITKQYNTNPIDGNPVLIQEHIPVGFEVQNGLLMQKKTLAERVRDSIKFPALKHTDSVINGAALIIFAVGAFILYSQLPTRPELVIGILLVSIAGNIIVRAH